MRQRWTMRIEDVGGDGVARTNTINMWRIGKYSHCSHYLIPLIELKPIISMVQTPAAIVCKQRIISGCLLCATPKLNINFLILIIYGWFFFHSTGWRPHIPAFKRLINHFGLFCTVSANRTNCMSPYDHCWPFQNKKRVNDEWIVLAKYYLW